MAETEIPVPKPNIHTESSLIRGTKNSLNPKDLKDTSRPILKGGIKKKELTFGEKLKRSFVKEDIKDVRDYIIFDVIIPSIKKSLLDTVIGTTAQLLGISVPRNIFNYSSGYNGNRQRLSPHERQYRDYTSIQREGTGSRITAYDRFYVQDYPFDYQEDANKVLEYLMDICDQYGWVSVAKFFEIADPEGTIAGKNPYTNYDFGWRSLEGAKVVFDGTNYIIALPPARPKS